MKYEKLCKEIIKGVGGIDNIEQVIHCMTRLRFTLKENSLANTEEVNNIEGVVTTVQSGGQYQVVIGNHVADVYKELLKIGNIKSPNDINKDEEKSENKTFMGKVIDIILGVMFPVLGVLCATGAIKGILTLCTTMKWMDPQGGTYSILYTIGDGLLYFFPIFIGYTSAKKFKMNELTGMAIGASLLYPTISTIMAGDALFTIFKGSVIESPVYITFLGIPVILMSYSSTIIPIIVATFIGSKLENKLNKIIPAVIKSFVVPMITLLVIVPFTFIIIGPISVWIGQIIGATVEYLYGFSPIIVSFVVGALWLPLVVTGLHGGLIPIAINNLMTMGYDVIFAMSIGQAFAAGGAALGVLLKTKNKKLKSLSMPAVISTLFGITEPAVYGVLLPSKRPFIVASLVSGIAGGFMAITETKTVNFGGMGIFGITSYIDSNPNSSGYGVIFAAIAMAGSFILATILTMIVYKDKNDESKEDNKADENLILKEDTLASPFDGKVYLLSDIEDKAFASGALGKGIAIEPTNNELKSPVDGVITTIFPSKHAIGIVGKNGAEILIHVGMDTVKLNGKYFECLVKEGQHVKKGEVLLNIDFDKIKEEGYSVVTPMTITNSTDYLDIIESKVGTVSSEETVLTIVN